MSQGLFIRLCATEVFLHDFEIKTLAFLMMRHTYEKKICFQASPRQRCVKDISKALVTADMFRVVGVGDGILLAYEC